MKTLAERVIEARTAAGLNKAELQRELDRILARWGIKDGISHSSLVQLETGVSKTMKAHTALAIARVTGFRPEYLLYGELPRAVFPSRDGAVAGKLQGSGPRLPSGMLDAENSGLLAMAIETLESRLKKTGHGTSPAGKAEILGLVVQWARAGETQAAIERKVDRMLVAIGKRGDH